MDGVGSLVEQATSLVERVSHELEPELLDGEAALRLFAALARLGKLVDACEAMVSRRVDECGAHRATGHLSPAHLLAATAGVSVARASDAIRTGHQLVDQPAVDDAFRAGRLSLEQASVISDAVVADPSSERVLVAVAPRETLRTLQDKARAVRAAACDDRLGRYQRQCAARGVWHRSDADGMVRGSFAFPPDVGARFVTRLEAETDTEYRRAYAEGRHEPHHCYRADALARLVHGDPATKPGSFDGVIVVSHEALRRGTVEPGETCMIAGFGDVPLEVARDLLADAFLKGVLVHGTRVEAVRHFGRRPSAAVRTALELQAILQHGAVVCSVPGCDRTVGIEWDHIEPHAAGGPTQLANMQPLCRPHHRAKTAADQTRTRRSSNNANRAPP